MLLDDGSRKYVWGLGLAYAVDPTGAVQVDHPDGLGSVRAITDASGSVVQTYQTDAFGSETQSQGSLSQPFQYTGEPRDAETGFVYLRARLYDPQLGRFLQRDPVFGRVTTPCTLNRYTYVRNNPITRVDPVGTKSRLASDVDPTRVGEDGGCEGVGPAVGKSAAGMFAAITGGVLVIFGAANIAAGDVPVGLASVFAGLPLALAGGVMIGDNAPAVAACLKELVPGLGDLP